MGEGLEEGRKCRGCSPEEPFNCGFEEWEDLDKAEDVTRTLQMALGWPICALCGSTV